MNTINKIQINDTVYDINGPATAQEYGLIKLGYTQNNKNYPVLLSSGKAYVNVPWENTTYTLGGLMGASAKGSVTQPIYWDGSSFVSTTYKLNADVPSDAVFTDTVYTLPTATASSLGGIKAAGYNGTMTTEQKSHTANRSYEIEVDSDGKAFVNVPWIASQSEGGDSAGFDSISAGSTTISSSVQSDLYISSHGGASVMIDQGMQDLVNKSVVYIDINAATNNQYGGIKIDSQSSYIDQNAKNYPVQLTSGTNSGYAYVYVPVTDGTDGADGADGADGIGISNISIQYGSSNSGISAPSSWSNSIPSVNSGDYLWTKIVITTTATTDNTTTAYSVARQGIDGSGGSSSAMTIESSLSGPAQPNVLYNLGTLSSATTITLDESELSSNTAAEYLFRFKTGTTSGNVASFTVSQGSNTEILYPYDYILNLNTEYEVSILWDGSKLLVRNCAYQSNS